jgi:tetratricopeptide (TPR) repeat protein
VPEIARRLGVDAVIEGTVARAGDRVRVTAELLGVRPERHLWGDRYEREVRDVLDLQAEVAQTIARQVRAQVTREERARLERPHPVRPEALEAYLKGRHYLNRLDQRWLRSALDCFQQAVRADSSCPQAWAGLADTYYQLSNVYLPPRVAMPLAHDAAERAVRLDPDLAEGHAALGVYHAAYDWDWAAAEREYRRALVLNPNHAQTHLYYGQLLQIFGRLDESVAQLQRAAALNPLSAYVRAQAAYLTCVAGRCPEAVADLRALERSDPGYAPVHFNLAQAYDALGRHDEAIAELRKAIALGDTPFPRALLGCSLARAGRRAEARAVLADLERGEEE